MFPPVNPKRRSRSSGDNTCRSITARLKLGAYSLRMSKQRSAKRSFASSQPPFRRWYGAYCTKNDITCLPAGAPVGVPNPWGGDLRGGGGGGAAVLALE